MPNTKSAKRAERVSIRRTKVNKARKTRLKTVVRNAEEALAAGSGQAAADAMKEAGPVIMRSAQKGLIHKRTASRKISRLTKRLKALGTGGGASA